MSPACCKERDLLHFLDLVVDVVEEGIICTDFRGSVLLANAKALSMWDYGEEWEE